MLKILSRDSRLAKIQVKEVISNFPEIEYELITMKTFGDIHREISLFENKQQDFFTDEIDKALLEEKGDIAVHSAKDLPYPLNDGLEVIALTKSPDKSDSLVSRENKRLMELPKGAKVGTSSKIRKEQIEKIRPDLEVVSIRGTIEERIGLIESCHVDAVIIATCALLRLGHSDKTAGPLPFKTHPLQGNLAVVAKRGRSDLKALFYSIDIRKNFGKVWLVGFGPGDPDLMTIKADKVLASADIIYYDDLIDSSVLNKYHAEAVYVGKRKGEHSKEQDEINEMLYQSAVSGKNTVRLKGGDPLVFGRGGEESAYLNERLIPVEIIPGVSAANASAASFSIPLTRRRVSNEVTFRTAHTAHKYESQDKGSNTKTLVYYMGASKLSELSDRLVSEGWDSAAPVALISNGSRYDEECRITSIKEMSGLRATSPLTIIIGDVVKEKHIYDKILYTGLEIGGFIPVGKIFHYPLIKTVPVNASVPQAGQFDAVVFTSKSAVRYFFGKSNLDNQKILAIGPSTGREVNNFGYKVDFVPDTADSDELALMIQKSEYKAVLYPCSDLSRNALHNLKQVRPFVCYKTEKIIQPKLDLSFFRSIVFTSPSTVEAFFDIYNEIPKTAVCYVIGKHTALCLKNHNADGSQIIQVRRQGEIIHV